MICAHCGREFALAWARMPYKAKEGRSRAMSTRNNCMFLLPHELTGLGEWCGLLKSGCNGYGRRCVAYVPHNAESRKALAEAIAKRKEEMEKGGAK